MDNNSMMPYRSNVRSATTSSSYCRRWTKIALLDLSGHILQDIAVYHDGLRPGRVNGVDMPSQETIEAISDNIYDDMMRSNPDMAEYIRRYSKTRIAQHTSGTGPSSSEGVPAAAVRSAI